MADTYTIKFRLAPLRHRYHAGPIRCGRLALQLRNVRMGGNATAPGGFYRIRRGSKTTPMPINVHAAKGMLMLTFNEPMPSTEAAMKVWSLKIKRDRNNQNLLVMCRASVLFRAWHAN
jgi:hypothetical protein